VEVGACARRGHCNRGHGASTRVATIAVGGAPPSVRLSRFGAEPAGGRLTKYGLQAAQPALQSFVQEARGVAEGPWGNGSESESGNSLGACRERIEQGAVTAGRGWMSRMLGSADDGGPFARGSGEGSTLRKGLLSARTCCRAAAYLNNRLQGMRGRPRFGSTTGLRAGPAPLTLLSLYATCGITSRAWEGRT
jgi:hypothetical protein